MLRHRPHSNGKSFIGQDMRLTLTRMCLPEHDGLTSYLRLLSVKYWHHVALNSLAGWVTTAQDAHLLEASLLEPSSIEKLINCVDNADRYRLLLVLSSDFAQYYSRATFDATRE